MHSDGALDAAEEVEGVTEETALPRQGDRGGREGGENRNVGRIEKRRLLLWGGGKAGDAVEEEILSSTSSSYNQGEGEGILDEDGQDANEEQTTDGNSTSISRTLSANQVNSLPTNAQSSTSLHRTYPFEILDTSFGTDTTFSPSPPASPLSIQTVSPGEHQQLKTQSGSGVETRGAVSGGRGGGDGRVGGDDVAFMSLSTPAPPPSRELRKKRSSRVDMANGKRKPSKSFKSTRTSPDLPRKPKERGTRKRRESGGEKANEKDRGRRESGGEKEKLRGSRESVGEKRRTGELEAAEVDFGELEESSGDKEKEEKERGKAAKLKDRKSSRDYEAGDVSRKHSRREKLTKKRNSQQLSHSSNPQNHTPNNHHSSHRHSVESPSLPSYSSSPTTPLPSPHTNSPRSPRRARTTSNTSTNGTILSSPSSKGSRGGGGSGGGLGSGSGTKKSKLRTHSSSPNIDVSASSKDAESVLRKVNARLRKLNTLLNEWNANNIKEAKGVVRDLLSMTSDF
eukprot:TRINITY_DN1197_c0_g1_i1.p1 TRINITY_DN1197_c0_g1~~TRINITY_DN1197_c0_g1_i1.p1  ORF type:complete len:582 (-),score=150.12 TRINITY_DN1197_c0_g1_i1:138-1670(-)